MKRILFTVIALVSISFPVQAKTTFSLNAIEPDSLEQIVKKYYKLNVKMMQKGSSKADIDNIFKLFSDDFVYSHPKYGGNYSKDDLYKGYENNLAKGSYNSRVADIRIEKVIVGENAVAVSRTFMMNTDEGVVTPHHAQLVFFEFKEGKISRIAEYW